MSRLSVLKAGKMLSAILFCAGPFMWAQSPELPPGPMQAKVKTACTECHDSNLIMQQRLSKASWTKEVDKMIKWGAVVEASDREGFIDYLSSNFPPDKALEVAVRTAAPRSKK